MKKICAKLRRRKNPEFGRISEFNNAKILAKFRPKSWDWARKFGQNPRKRKPKTADAN